MKLENVRNIFVYSDYEKAKKIIDSKKPYRDIDALFFNKFFSKEHTCNGIIMVNKKGVFKKKAGEYTQENIRELLNDLK